MEGVDPMIIGVSGKAQAGKDTVGNYLVANYGFTRTASADALKRIARNTFKWDGVKDEKGRRLLQELGCSIRNYNEDFWIDITLAEIVERCKTGQDKNFVITDVRFLNEATRLKNMGAVLIRLERPGIPTYDHISEKELDDYAGFDFKIKNDSGLEQLYSRIGVIMTDLTEGARDGSST